MKLMVAMCLHPEKRPLSGSDGVSATQKGKSDNATSYEASNPRRSHRCSQRSLRKRKPRRVLYPARVRKYLPPEEKDPVKKWLVILGAIVLLQIFSEDGGQGDTWDYGTEPTSDMDTTLPANATTTMETGPSFVAPGGQISVHRPANSSLVYPNVFSFLTETQETMASLSASTYHHGERTLSSTEPHNAAGEPSSRVELDSVCT